MWLVLPSLLSQWVRMYPELIVLMEPIDEIEVKQLNLFIEVFTLPLLTAFVDELDKQCKIMSRLESGFVKFSN